MNLKTWIASGALAVVVIGGSITGATLHNASVQADQMAQADQKSVSLKIDRMATSVGATVETIADVTIQAAADAQAIIDAKAAAAQQAAQAAADAAAAAQAAAAAPVKRSAAAAPAGPIKCPAGSSANSGDGPNDTSCFPDICFHSVLPDPNLPQCDVAFKP